jgi:Na+-transporting methylmalonyl-CoA/oxaloacetate decarboxylase gamma subunit
LEVIIVSAFLFAKICIRSLTYFSTIDIIKGMQEVKKNMPSIIQGLEITVLGIGVVLLALWGLSLLVGLMSKFVQKGTNRGRGTETKQLAAVIAAISAVVPPERIKSIDIKRI